MSNRRIVRHAMLSYRGEDGVKRHALRGQVVELTDDELARAERLEAVGPEDDAAAITAATPVVYPLGPDEVLAAGEQADDAGSDKQADDTAADTPAEKPARRSRSSS